MPGSRLLQAGPRRGHVGRGARHGGSNAGEEMREFVGEQGLVHGDEDAGRCGKLVVHDDEGEIEAARFRLVGAEGAAHARQHAALFLDADARRPTRLNF